MSTTAVAQLQSAQFELEAFLGELVLIQEKLSHFGESSTLSIKNYFDTNLPLWQRKFEELKTNFAKLPGDIKKHEFTLNVVTRLDYLAIQINHLRRQFQSSDRADWRNQLANTLPDLAQIKASANNLCESFKLFQFDPFFQRLLASGRELASKKDLQWGRKFFHTANGLIGLYFWAYSGLAEWIVLSVLGAYFLYAITTEIVRRKYPPYNDWMIRTIGWMMREHEKSTISSATYYISTMFFVMLIFPKNISMLTLFYVAVGDTVAGIIGVLWGKHKISPKVSIEGAAACFLVCALATWFFVTTGIPGLQLAGTQALIFSLFGGFIAAFAEGSFKKFDDNLIMPLLSAPLLWILCLAFT